MSQSHCVSGRGANLPKRSSSSPALSGGFGTPVTGVHMDSKVTSMQLTPHPSTSSRIPHRVDPTKLASMSAVASVVIMLVALIALDLWWLWRFRSGYPLSLDEAGYMAIAFDNTAALRLAGVSGLWDQFQVQNLQAPLVPLLTVPVHLIFGEHIIQSFFILEAFFALLVFASYGIGSRLVSPSCGALTALVVATMPGVTYFTRQYHFAVPCAALFAASTYALLKSEGLRKVSWAAAWGILLGLTVLARTMMLAIVPGLITVAIIGILIGRDMRRQRIFHFALSIILATMIAAIWYWRNLGSVLAYLTSYGYGANSETYGPSRSPASWEFWTARFIDMINQGFYLPLTLVLLVAATLLTGSLLIATVRAHSFRGYRCLDRSTCRSDTLVIAGVLVCGYLALTSSRNMGTGFVLPLLPLAAALGVSCAFRIPWPRISVCLTATLVLIAGMNFEMNADIILPLSEPRWMTLPGSAGLSCPTAKVTFGATSGGRVMILVSPHPRCQKYTWDGSGLILMWQVF